MYKSFFKRLLDLTVALIGFILLSPVFLIVMIGLYLANNGKPFFFQVRPGKNERLFKIIKFKTMNDNKGLDGTLLSDAERLTAIGAFVRKTSLDEIPQLLNVIIGDMSLIGPRPLLPEYLTQYNKIQKRRHEVRPGITGLAQVRGRNMMKFSERLIQDVYYVNNLSLLLDLKILVLTVQSVLFKTSNVSEGQTIEDVDDIGLSKNLSSNHFKKKDNEH